MYYFLFPVLKFVPFFPSSSICLVNGVPRSYNILAVISTHSLGIVHVDFFFLSFLCRVFVSLTRAHWHSIFLFVFIKSTNLAILVICFILNIALFPIFFYYTFKPFSLFFPQFGGTMHSSEFADGFRYNFTV